MITTARLDLVSMAPAFMRASLDGQLAEAATLLGVSLPADWPGNAEYAMTLRLGQLARDPLSLPWLLRAMVLRTERAVIGRIGFHAPPDDRGAVEIGYTVWPAYRRQGYAEEAVRAIFDWARQRARIACFVASVRPDNVPSLGLVRKLGFTQVGTQWDDRDGEELVFELSNRPDG